MASKSNTSDETEKLEVLTHRRGINENLAAALQSLERGDTDETKQHLCAIQRNILGFEQYLSATLEPKHYAPFRLADSTAATKVFAIPELLESILKELRVPDLMRCYAVNRTYRDALQTSKKLQICSFLLADTEPREQRFPLNTKQFMCTTPRPELRIGGLLIYVRARLDTTCKIGPRWKKMLVSQPPTYSMQYYATCYGIKPGGCMLGGWAGDRQSIHSNEGLTIGDLFEVVETMSKAHSGCAASDDEGPRMVTVTFGGPGAEDSV